MKSKIRKLTFALGLSTVGTTLILSGCHGNSGSSSSPTPSPSPVITGKVMDGPSNPIRNAQVILYSAGTNGSTKLGEATSNNNGEFSINYTLPSSGQYVYIIAQGGSTSGNNNSNINLVNIIGSQGNIPNQVVIDELTTVASYQAFSHNWTSTANPILLQTNENTNSLKASFSTYQSLVNPITGDFTLQYPITTPTGNQLGAQANTLALCVQDASKCSVLMGYYQTEPNQDTFSLMAGLKQASTSALVSTTALLAASNTLPYPLASTLNSTALSIIYSGSFNQPYGITSDKDGNIWITNVNGDGLTELKSNANGSFSVQQYSPTDYDLGDHPFGITADNQGNIWVANHSINTVTELVKNQDGTYSPQVFENGYGFSAPYDLASDSEGNIWVSNNQNYTLTEIKKNQDGTYSHSIITGTGIGFNVPMGIAVDQGDNVWVSDSVGAAVTELIKVQDYKQIPYTGSNYEFYEPYGVSIDRTGNVWIANQNGNSVTELDKNLGYLPIVYNSSEGYNFNTPHFLAADQANDIWVANTGGNSITEIINEPNGMPVSYVYNSSSYGLSSPTGITVDKAGNIWVTNNGNNTVTEIIN